MFSKMSRTFDDCWSTLKPSNPVAVGVEILFDHSIVVRASFLKSLSHSA